MFALASSPAVFFEDLWYAFYDTYISTDTVYENLDMNGMVSIQYIIIGIYLGLAAAAIWSVVSRRLQGSFVQLLISRECFSKETARSLPELDAADRLVARYSVKKSVNLRRIVRCVDEEVHEAERQKKEAEYLEKCKENKKLPKKFKYPPFKFDLDTDRFYIPEECKEAAMSKFTQKGTSPWSLVLFVTALTVAFVLLLVFLPFILSALNAFVGSIK